MLTNHQLNVLLREYWRLAATVQADLPSAGERPVSLNREDKAASPNRRRVTMTAEV